ncbi:MAG TPA: hypothetical protein PKG74_03080 [Candidatus Colwellbacteria bacterium]|nr:hypothetical protein [Candidatus Colwellbacteria bacterium]
MKKVIAILAAGTTKSWDRHSVKIGGETLLERIVRQLKSRGDFDIVISSNKIGDHAIEGSREIVNPLTGNDLGCFYGLKDLNPDLFIFGDVYFTDRAIDRILAGEDHFFGRTSESGSKRYGEMFAVRPDADFWNFLEIAWTAYQAGKLKRLWSWDLYSMMRGKNFYQFGNTGDFTEIKDETEDFDKPEDLEKWFNLYPSKR